MGRWVAEVGSNGMRIRHRMRSRVIGGLLASALTMSVMSVSSIGGFVGSVHANPLSLGAGGEYHPITPARIYDTRPSAAFPNGHKIHSILCYE